MKAARPPFLFPFLTVFFISFSRAQTTSPLVQKMYNGEWPQKDEIQKNYDYYFEQAAIQAYIASLPALNVIGIRDASEEKFMSYLDLKETGPLVVYAPPGVIGMFTDFFQRTLTDVGAAGPDRNAGGLYLLLPPNYDGHMCQADISPLNQELTTYFFSSARCLLQAKTDRILKKLWQPQK